MARLHAGTSALGRTTSTSLTPTLITAVLTETYAKGFSSLRFYCNAVLKVTVTGSCGRSLCGLSQGYWRNHPSDYITGHFTGRQICGVDFDDILCRPVKENKWLIVAKQYIAFILNIYYYNPPQTDLFGSVSAAALAALNLE